MTRAYDLNKIKKLIENNRELYIDILTMNVVLYGYDYSGVSLKGEFDVLKKRLYIGDFISYLDYYKPYRVQIRKLIMFIINNKLVSDEESDILYSIATRKEEEEI